MLPLVVTQSCGLHNTTPILCTRIMIEAFYESRGCGQLPGRKQKTKNKTPRLNKNDSTVAFYRLIDAASGTQDTNTRTGSRERVKAIADWGAS
jgi:hypothetical protein